MRVETDGSVLTVYIDDVAAGWEQWVMLSSDRHHDNIHCDRALERQQLELAKQRNALILDFGDLFCAMQGKYDPRSSMDDIRPEDVGSDYLDRIVRHAAEGYGPYANNFLLISMGNHETKILEKHGHHLTSALVHRLNSDYGGNVHVGKYGGWVRFMFRMNKTKSTSRKLKYHHGARGGGEVTRGTIQTNRQAVYLPDADIVVNGHTHDNWILPIARERISDKGKIYRDLLWFVRTPGYKNSYKDGSSGWEVEKWMPPKPMGCVWMRFHFHNGNLEMELTPQVS